MTYRVRSDVRPSTVRVQPKYRNYTALTSKTTLPCSSVTSNSDSEISVTVPGNSSSMMDYVTKDFAKKRARGLVINNPMFKETVSYEDQSMFCSQELKKYYCMNYGSIPVFFSLYSTEKVGGEYSFDQVCGGANVTYIALPSASGLETQDSLKARAVTSAWANLNNSDILIGAAIAESGKTMRGLLTTARKVLKIGKALRNPKVAIKRFNSKSIKQHSRDLEDVRMEVRYNLRPLYFDILGLMKLTCEPKGIRTTARGETHDSVSARDSKVVYSPIFQNTKLLIEREAQRTISVRAGVLAEGREQTLWQRAGIALLAETAWELLPFSFIADWFTNFGDVISSWAPSPGVKTLASWVVVETTETQNVTCRLDSVVEYLRTAAFVAGQVSKTEVVSEGLNGRKSFTKTSIARTPNPSRSFTPRISVNLNSQKLLDLATIGRNVYRTFSTKK